MRICIMVWIHLDPPNTRMWRDDLTITANQSGLRLVSYPLTYRDDRGALDPRLAHAPSPPSGEQKKERGVCGAFYPLTSKSPYKEQPEQPLTWAEAWRPCACSLQHRELMAQCEAPSLCQWFIDRQRQQEPRQFVLPFVLPFVRELAKRLKRFGHHGYNVTLPHFDWRCPLPARSRPGNHVNSDPGFRP